MDRLSNNAFTPLGPGEDGLDHEALGGNTDPDLILWILAPALLLRLTLCCQEHLTDSITVVILEETPTVCLALGWARGTTGN